MVCAIHSFPYGAIYRRAGSAAGAAAPPRRELRVRAGLQGKEIALTILGCTIFHLLGLLVEIVLNQRFGLLVLTPAMAVLLPMAVGVPAFSQKGLEIAFVTALTVGTLQIGYLLGAGILISYAVARIGGLRSRAEPHPARRTAY